MATTSIDYKHPYITLQWQHLPSGGAWQDATNLSGYVGGQGTKTLELSDATEAEAGFLRCRLTRPDGGITDSDSAALTATATAPNITVGIGNQVPYEGESATYGPITVTGSPTPTLLWEAETADGNNTWADADTVFGADGSGQGTDTYVIANAVPADNRDIRVTATNTAGSDVSQAALTVTPKLAFTTDPVDQTVLETVSGTPEYMHDFTLNDIGAWTHTRASDATAPNASGTIVTYTTDQPAWYRDQGLQLEDQRTNDLRYSSDLTQTSKWIARGPVIVSSTEPSPDGGNAGTHLALFNQADQDIRQGSSSNGIGDATNSPSFYIRGRDSNTHRFINPQGASRGHWNIDGSLLSGQWELITRNHLAVTVVNEFINSSGGSYGIWFQEEFGSATTNIDVWGCQIEQASFPTSYMPTPSASSYTRAATACSATFAELGDPLPAGGVANDFCLQIVMVLARPRSNYSWGDRILHIAGTPENNDDYVWLGQTGASQLRLEIRQNGGTQQSILTSNIDGKYEQDLPFDLRLRVASTGCSWWVNGVKEATEISGPIANWTEQLTRIFFAMDRGGSSKTNMRVTKFRIVPEALTDEEIQNWT